MSRYDGWLGPASRVCSRFGPWLVRKTSGKPSAGQVVAGDAHPLDLQPDPAVGVGVQPRRTVGAHPPELLLALRGLVELAIVADPQVAPAGAIPVAEQHRQGAEPGRELERRGVPGCPGRRPEQVVLAARAGRLAVRAEREVRAERQRRERRRTLPGGAERGRHGLAAVERPGLVGPLEAAVAEPAQEHALARAQDRQVDAAVAVDVERIGADHPGRRGRRVVDRFERERTAGRALVPQERGGTLAAGEVQLRLAVVVAVEDRHPATDREAEVAVVGVVDPARGRLVDEVRGGQRGRRRGATEPAERERPDPDRDDGHDRDTGDDRGDPPPAAHPTAAPGRRSVGRRQRVTNRRGRRSTAARAPRLRCRRPIPSCDR